MGDNRTAVRGRAKAVIGGADRATLTGIRLALEAEGILVCGEAATLAELMSCVQHHQPHVCLVDGDLDGDLLEAVTETAARSSSVAVVLLAADVAQQHFLDAMAAGVRGYVDRHASPAALGHIVRAVLRGEPAVPRALVGALIDGFRQRGARRHVVLSGGRGVDLTEREWHVFMLLREGLSTREIADRLLISDVTVRRHIGAVVRKLEVDSRNDAVKLLRTA